VVQANLLAACTTNAAALNQCYNVALGERTTLNELFDCLQTALKRKTPELPMQKANYREFRQGDIQHSLANISKARDLLGYSPECPIAEGLELAMDWYCKHLG
jgi:UDP-N-acetylglucosamine 4-epimerase